MSKQLDSFFAEFETLANSDAKNYDKTRFAYLTALSKRLKSTHYSSNSELIAKALKKLRAYRDEMNQHRTQVERLNDGGLKTPLNELKELIQVINQPIIDQTRSKQKGCFDTLLDQQEKSFSGQNSEQKEHDDLLEMQSIQYFRESVKYSRIDQTVEHAINDLPQNPGPHNPHMLAINALVKMRDLSPSYLRRFAAYIETLLWLEKNAIKLKSES